MADYNGFLIVDKPEGLTSHQVIGRLRRWLSFRRIGHTGTLDPMATGVLPLLFGRATRASDFIMDGNKRYRAAFRLGLTTDTQDSTGRILTEWTGGLPSVLDIRAALPQFTGDIMQAPPMASAVKIGGQKLYQLHRKGVEIERPARRIHVTALSLSADPTAPAGANGVYVLDIDCSKGTYVRTLIHDLGQALGCGAAMTALRRLYAAPFTLDEAVTLDRIERAVAQETFADLLRPIDAVFARFPALTVDGMGEHKIRHGAVVFRSQVLEGWPARPAHDPERKTRVRVYGPGGFLMLGKIGPGDRVTCEKSFFEVDFL